MATLNELKTTIGKLQKQADKLEAKRSQALETVRSLVSQYGFSSAEVTSGGKAKTATVGSSRPPMYKDPKTGMTWNGWGKPPRWIPADKSKREAFLIDKAVKVAKQDTPVEQEEKPAAAAKKSTVKKVVAKKGTGRLGKSGPAAKNAGQAGGGKRSSAQP